ncbi:MAG: ABC transporter ATP-binding protein, partial [Spirochaetes bacterium]|nr:ABC transporter ATP-binding protein [Spirochaetota bacterium]
GLVNDPEIILMDEPTVGIDPQSRNKIYQLVTDLKNKGITILYTTHYMEEANKLCDKIAIIDRGRIMITDNPKLILKKYGVIHITYKLEKRVKKDFINQLYKLKSIVDVKENNKELIIISSCCNENIELIDNIRKVSKKNNFKMSLINIIEPTIENIFLEITGRSLRDIT